MSLVISSVYKWYWRKKESTWDSLQLLTQMISTHGFGKFLVQINLTSYIWVNNITRD